jgi:luciferase-like monooxygenase
MTGMQTPSERITAAVAAWPGVEMVRGRQGELAFSVGRRELGHLHGDRAVHLAFPEDVWLELREQGRIVEHPAFPGKPGPAVRRIEDDADADVRDVIELLRLNYDRIVADPTGGAEPDTEGPGRPRDADYGPPAQ